MAIDRANDLLAFRAFIDEQLARGGPAPKLDEALALWQDDNAPDAQRQATTEAIRRGFEDLDAGRTEDAFEFLGRMREMLRAAPRR